MIKKVLQGLLVMGAAAAVSLGATAYNADAAGITPKNYQVDYANQNITVAALEAGNTKLYVAKATVSTNKAGITTVKYGAYTEYDAVKGMKIDISPYVATKDVYLAIKGNKTTDPTLVKLSASPAKIKAVVDAKNTTVAIQDITDKKNPVEIAGTEYCTTYGKWTDYTIAGAKPTYAATTTVKLDASNYTKVGATLRFRVKASATLAGFTALETIGEDKDGNVVQAYTSTGNFASKELKVKIPKTANGPKATINYVTQTITIPKTAEYRVQAVNGALGAFTAPANPEDKKTVVINYADLKRTAATEFDLRTAATETKPASKITEYTFDKIGAVVAQTYTTKLANVSTTAKPGAYDVSNAVIGGADFETNLSVSKVVLNSKTMAATITVTNKTADVYEFIVTDAPATVPARVSGLTLPAATDKVTGKAAAGKNGTIKGKSGQYVYVRKAANAKTCEWSTPYVFFGVIGNEK